MKNITGEGCFSWGRGGGIGKKRDFISHYWMWICTSLYFELHIKGLPGVCWPTCSGATMCSTLYTHSEPIYTHHVHVQPCTVVNPYTPTMFSHVQSAELRPFCTIRFLCSNSIIALIIVCCMYVYVQLYMYYLAAALYLCICIVLENAAAGFALKSQYGLMSRRCSVGKHLPGNQCNGTVLLMMVMMTMMLMMMMM